MEAGRRGILYGKLYFCMTLCICRQFGLELDIGLDLLTICMTLFPETGIGVCGGIDLTSEE